MMNEAGETNLLDDTGENSQKLKQPWKGVSIFYTEQSKPEDKHVFFLDTPAGLIPCFMTEQEMDDAPDFIIAGSRYTRYK